MYIIIDTETIGLPLRSYSEFPYYKQLKAYEQARLIQLSYQMTDLKEASMSNKVHNFIIKRRSIFRHL